MEQTLTIPYDEALLEAMQLSPERFAEEARLLLAIKLYEVGRLSSGLAAQLAGLDRVSFLFELGRFGVSPIGVDPDELTADMRHA